MPKKNDGPQRQFTFTRREDLSEYQKHMFDLMQAWGSQRLQMLTLLFKTAFSEEEVLDDAMCTAKLYMLSKGINPNQTAASESQPIYKEMATEQVQENDSSTKYDVSIEEDDD